MASTIPQLIQNLEARHVASGEAIEKLKRRYRDTQLEAESGCNTEHAAYLAAGDVRAAEAAEYQAATMVEQQLYQDWQQCLANQ